MSEKLDFCFLLIVLQGGVEDRLNVEESVGFSLGHGSCREGEKRLVDDRERERRVAAASCSITDMDRYGTTWTDACGLLTFSTWALVS
jgi:hypothetical protein